MWDWGSGLINHYFFRQRANFIVLLSGQKESQCNWQYIKVEQGTNLTPFNFKQTSNLDIENDIVQRIIDEIIYITTNNTVNFWSDTTNFKRTYNPFLIFFFFLKTTNINFTSVHVYMYIRLLCLLYFVCFSRNCTTFGFSCKKYNDTLNICSGIPNSSLYLTPQCSKSSNLNPFHHLSVIVGNISKVAFNKASPSFNIWTGSGLCAASSDCSLFRGGSLESY